MGKAVLLYWHKAKLQNRYVFEMKLHQVEKTAHYKDGRRYRLILLDMKTGRRVLMDNHHPKGHHVHLDQDEKAYSFVDENQLFDDFKQFCLDHIGVNL